MMGVLSLRYLFVLLTVTTALRPMCFLAKTRKPTNKIGRPGFLNRSSMQRKCLTRVRAFPIDPSLSPPNQEETTASMHNKQFELVSSLPVPHFANDCFSSNIPVFDSFSSSSQLLSFLDERSEPTSKAVKKAGDDLFEKYKNADLEAENSAKLQEELKLIRQKPTKANRDAIIKDEKEIEKNNKYDSFIDKSIMDLPYNDPRVVAELTRVSERQQNDMFTAEDDLSRISINAPIAAIIYTLTDFYFSNVVKKPYEEREEFGEMTTAERTVDVMSGWALRALALFVLSVVVVTVK
mmetsp:Transcript_11530/g.13152  ORF Transcript_11530/g.13152 Transcript_11530/m.13152 type:complete len:294 (+) Transcript_11530:230-1111(+)